MQNRTNYHSHSVYCDGRADMESFVRFALSQGFTSYGFTSHAPLPFCTFWTMERDLMDQYLAEFQRLKVKYSGQIELYVGLEIDYLDENSYPALPYFQSLPLDYRIGSVHLLRDERGEAVDLDTSVPNFIHIINTHFHGDIEWVVRTYYDHQLRMLELGGFDIIGHPDKIHYNANAYRPGLLDESWYDDLVHQFFAQIARSGVMLEVNTKGWADKQTFFPNERYFGYLRKLGVPILVNSDAHYPDLINAGRNEALRALFQAGITSVMELHQGRWQSAPIIL